ncbi:5'-hydroxyaverantin dehydrogenase [Colletotrichum orbiculare MAFF 240422]|uniref:5'-hydroxyaverantin dehydrogenase n=1 Tax=Colletotrichum orbiculare (strain 104-T / ATCC 96160 / CBS 514.97 / LARS 414 / MAFF 240422) TaxID=1213857 RepID=N4VSM8_COLOR|nr:5'-hydroxyaverantin dehydrogenase [Colletotrichum orbiculare MAFF 240422]
MTIDAGYHNLVPATGLSEPVDTTKPYDPSALAGKTVLLTGGALGLGAAFAREWASHGANLVIGDINTSEGESLVAALRTNHPNGSHHFVTCDVTSWGSQVAFFKEAARLSPDGKIDVVVANAGINLSGANHSFDNPSRSKEDPDAPAEPSTKTIAVNITGLTYTTHLGMFWLPRNGQRDDTRAVRDRCILLIGSIAGIVHLPGQSPYCMSKHAVTGLFRAMRATAYLTHRVRFNMLCPYFINQSNIFPGAAEAVFLGGSAGGATFGDVVDAATRLVADEGVIGRALLVGPKISDEERGVHDKIAAWDVYAEDYKDCEAFVWRWVRIMNTVEAARGWFGWVRDCFGIAFRR